MVSQALIQEERVDVFTIKAREHHINNEHKIDASISESFANIFKIFRTVGNGVILSHGLRIIVHDPLKILLSDFLIRAHFFRIDIVRRVGKNRGDAQSFAFGKSKSMLEKAKIALYFLRTVKLSYELKT